MKQGGDTTPDTEKKGFHVRMPAELRARLLEAKQKNKTSFNQEVVDRLQASVENEDLHIVISRLTAAVEELTKRLDKLEA